MTQKTLMAIFQVPLGAFFIWLGWRKGVIRGAYSRLRGPGYPVTLIGRVAMVAAGASVMCAGIWTLLGF